MRALLILTTIIIIISITIILKLLTKIRILTEENKYADEANKWHKLAITDALTGVYNRNAYNLYIDENIKANPEDSVWIILFDVDNFKMINDTKGHLAGDAMLRTVAKNLLEVFSGHQYRVFRIGGDEFAVITRGLSENEIIELLIVLNKRLVIKGDIRLSKGYSRIEENPQEAFKYADEMMYADKMSKKEADLSDRNI